MAVSKSQPMRPAEIDLIDAANANEQAIADESARAKQAIADETERAKGEEERIEGKLDGIAIKQGTAPTDPAGENSPLTQTAVVLDCVREGDGEWGPDNVASGIFALAEGWDARATGKAAHAEGRSTQATGDNAHAEGNSTEASGQYSHAEGWNTHASGQTSHAEGYSTKATDQYSHAEGTASLAQHKGAHCEGRQTISTNDFQHVQGVFNSTAKINLASIIGGGTSNSNRKNINEIDWNGNCWFSGDVTCGTSTPYASLREAYDNRLTDSSVSTARLANEAVTLDKLAPTITALLQSIPAIEFDTGTSIHVPAESYIEINVTFGSPKAKAPLVFCSMQQPDADTVLIANVQSVTKTQATIVITNPGTNAVTDATLDWLAISGR